jgi:putative ABC transport system permease protein
MNSITSSLPTNPSKPKRAPIRKKFSTNLNLLQTVQIAWRAIIANTTRSILTALGVIIGVAAVIALTSLGSGATSGITKQFEGLGTNLLTVSSGQATNGGGPSIVRTTTQQTITLGDVEALRNIGANVAGVAPTVQSTIQAKFDANNMNVTVIGTWPDYETVRNASTSRGNWFTPSEMTARKRLAVIGFEVGSDLFGNIDPLGKQFKIGGVSFTVAGVLPDKGSNPFSSTNTNIFVPLTTYQQKLGKQSDTSGETTVQSVSVAAQDKKVLDELEAQIADVLAVRHKKATPEDYDFNVANQADALSSVNQVTTILNLFLGGVAGISLLVGGIGIMNIMLVSVTERTREIGIRKALGAKPRDILSQFLVEAFVLSVGGGLIGVILGMVLAFAVGAVTGITPIIGLSSIILSFGFSAAVGIFFGYYPALQAAKLDPVESLRYE